MNRNSFKFSTLSITLVVFFSLDSFAFGGRPHRGNVPSANGDQRSMSDRPNARSRATSGNPCSSPQLTAAVPRGGRESGSSITQSLPNSGTSERHCRVLNSMAQGNIPNHLRNLVPIQMGEVTICVMPDYMSLGTDADSVRVPVGRDEAVELAREMGFMLPSTTMVDQICAQARAGSGIGLSPSTMEPTSAMTTTRYFQRHDQTIDQQVRSSGGRVGDLVACHKKDLVMNGVSQSSRVPIYGWNRANGRPIQPFTTGAHGDSYADYSHGVRLVSQTAFVNGEAVSLASLMSNPQYRSALAGGNSLTNSDINTFNASAAGHGSSDCFRPRRAQQQRLDPNRLWQTGSFR